MSDRKPIGTARQWAIASAFFWLLGIAGFVALRVDTALRLERFEHRCQP